MSYILDTINGKKDAPRSLLGAKNDRRCEHIYTSRCDGNPDCWEHLYVYYGFRSPNIIPQTKCKVVADHRRDVGLQCGKTTCCTFYNDPMVQNMLYKSLNGPPSDQF